MYSYVGALPLTFPWQAFKLGLLSPTNFTPSSYFWLQPPPPIGSKLSDFHLMIAVEKLHISLPLPYPLVPGLLCSVCYLGSILFFTVAVPV